MPDASAKSNPPHDAFSTEVIARIVRESRLAQGLPVEICDPSVIARLAVFVASVSK